MPLQFGQRKPISKRSLNIVNSVPNLLPLAFFFSPLIFLACKYMFVVGLNRTSNVIYFKTNLKQGAWPGRGLVYVCPLL